MTQFTWSQAGGHRVSMWESPVKHKNTDPKKSINIEQKRSRLRKRNFWGVKKKLLMYVDFPKKPSLFTKLHLKTNTLF